MEIHERQLVLDQLDSSEARLLELVRELTPEQWSFREAPERWSIAENIEHVIAFENFIMGVIADVMARPAELDKKAFAAEKEPLVLGLANARDVKFNAREVVRPVRRWLDTEEMVAELRKTRARTVAFVAETQAPLRDHFFPHVAFGDLDCYQWLVVMAQHGARHAAQIEEIKADPVYPVWHLARHPD
ncbi:DinB family protein [Acidicapsa ligni]|uniref:DinB family protein n=1 Tax=Acidicapsa ligni TaxID=542300 RepID=UPI0021DF482F|nr:DinB family protein [Acidicapsa ligni]